MQGAFTWDETWVNHLTSENKNKYLLHEKNPLSSPAMNFDWWSWKMTFGAINSCFLRIFLYALIQLFFSVIVVLFECHFRPFVERGLGCWTKASVFSTTLGPILQTRLATLWHNDWEVMEHTSYFFTFASVLQQTLRWNKLSPPGSRHLKFI